MASISVLLDKSYTEVTGFFLSLSFLTSEKQANGYFLNIKVKNFKWLFAKKALIC
jgi:hypothetical protein